jgi:hypothetical protein
MEAKEVVKWIKDREIQIVDLRFVDLPGLWQHFSVAAHQITEESFSDGFGFDGSSIRGFQQIQESDMLLFPDPDTCFEDPFTKVRTLNAICNVGDPVTGEPYSRDPRFIAGKAEKYLLPRAGRYRLFRSRNRNSSSSTRFASTRPITRVTTISIRTRASGTAAARRTRTWATSHATRKGTSRWLRWTACRISVPR